MFVLLFLAGGGAIEEVMVGSSELTAAAVGLDGADIEGADTSCVDGRLLFRAPVGEVGSGLTAASAAVGRVCKGEVAVEESTSVLSGRFDIGRCQRKRCAALWYLRVYVKRKKVGVVTLMLCVETQTVCFARVLGRWLRALGWGIGRDTYDLMSWQWTMF